MRAYVGFTAATGGRFQKHDIHSLKFVVGTCPNDCNLQGRCQDGECVCEGLYATFISPDLLPVPLNLSTHPFCRPSAFCYTFTLTLLHVLRCRLQYFSHVDSAGEDAKGRTATHCDCCQFRAGVWEAARRLLSGGGKCSVMGGLEAYREERMGVLHSIKKLFHII